MSSQTHVSTSDPPLPSVNQESESSESITPSQSDPTYSSSPFQSTTPIVNNKYHKVTQSKTWNLKPRVCLAHTKPSLVKEDLFDPSWFTAMQAEFNALQKNSTWSLVELPPNRTAMGCKWVFQIKENLDGSINKYKACLVAKGFHQQYGFDFNEVFSLVVKRVNTHTCFDLQVEHAVS